jgi:hypothetical protein
MKKIIVVLLLVLTGSVYATTDYKCVSNCQKKGYTYDYCMNQCTVDNSPKQQESRTIDQHCVNDCIKKGNPYKYCRQVCTF